MGPAEAQQPARNMGPRHGVPPLTRGFPMAADFVEEMEDRIQGTKEIQRGRFVRDSEGRTRLDWVFVEVPRRVVLTWKLTNIQRGEPEPALFELPPQ